MIEIKNTLNTEINIEIYTSIHTTQETEIHIEIYTSIHTGNINTYRDIYKHTHWEHQYI